jgi:DNA-binding MarR family transcriptional regulator
MGRIHREIKQTKPFLTLQQEAVVSLIRTTDLVRARLEEALRPWDLSIEQFNVLRILRGAPGRRHPTLEIASRMISRAPNITRLIDKLASKGLVSRCPEPGDRRVVAVKLSSRGLRAVNEASRDVDRADVRCLSGLPPRRVRALLEALDGIRAGLAEDAAPG